MKAKQQLHYYNQSDIFNLNPNFTKVPLHTRNKIPHNEPHNTSITGMYIPFPKITKVHCSSFS